MSKISNYNYNVYSVDQKKIKMFILCRNLQSPVCGIQKKKKSEVLNMTNTKVNQ